MQSVQQLLRVFCVSLCLLILVAAGLGLLLGWAEDAAAIAITQQDPIEVQVHLGNEADALKFEPEQLTFTAGQRYQLVLENPSSQKHYFTAKDFADNLWSQKVEAAGVEVKGAIHELELKPGAQAEWVFVPMKPGTYELHCSIAGHAEAGMVGQLIISDS
ncbi:MAG: multicopper oxidase domain-containing protein [Leptolyngbya sp. SIO4C5]|uniref:cupredoxin domain-containing protein n=1 Tax=Sphaerothrix gracilis TaxID=3151835 RepID=UPI0013C075AE|nr:multicopper oxidase domain-containing protein [Leptolyngbya sp. SIO4C5]